MLKTALIFIIVSLLACGTAMALEPTRIGVRTELPPRISSIGAAARYYSQGIGYTLITQYPAPEESIKIASEEIEPYARRTKVLPIEEAILRILPERYVLVIDHEHKLFTFENKGGE